MSWILERHVGGLHRHPVHSWEAIVGQLQKVEVDPSVGYGEMWSVGGPSYLAVIPVDYADGYSRALGNRAQALIHGRSAPVVGRVCMNILMVEVTGILGVSIGVEFLATKPGEKSGLAPDRANVSTFSVLTFL
jgi:alanine racemase